MQHAPLAVSIGEPAGIGPDLILKAFQKRVAHKLPVFCVFGDPELLKSRAAMLGYEIEIQAISTPSDALSVFTKALPVVDLGPSHKGRARRLGSGGRQHGCRCDPKEC